MRFWQVIKLGESDHAALGVLIQGPRCEDERLVALSDVVEKLQERAEWHYERRDLSAAVCADAAEFIKREFAGGG